METFKLCLMGNLVKKNQYGSAEEVSTYFGQNDTSSPRKCASLGDRCDESRR